MNKTFDDLVNEHSFSEDTEPTFDTLVKNYKIENKMHPFLETAKDYAKTIAKGTIEGVSRLGKFMGPLQSETKTHAQELLDQTQLLDEYLPTEEGYVQKGIRRGLRELPTNLSLPGGTALQTGVRTGLAGFAGQTVEQLGGPEWLQNAAELVAYIGPDVTKKLIESGNKGDLIKQAKKLGLTDKQITPLLQTDNWKKALSKIVNKRGKVEKALKETKNATSSVYDKLAESTAAKTIASPETEVKAINQIEDIIYNKLSSSNRTKILPDFQDFMNKPMSAENLMKLYRDVNETFGKNAKSIQILKGPIKEALKEINPGLAKDFDLINNLRSKYYKVSGMLKPTLAGDIVNASENLALFGSLATGYYPGFLAIVKEKAARKLAQEMITNPRLQQLSTKTLEAIKSNSLQATKALLKEFSNEIYKTDREAAEKLRNITDEEIKSLFD